MNALVVYDSLFGNTERIAQAIGDALAAQADVEVRRADDVKPEDLTGLDLLIVGTPTHGGRPSPATKTWLQALASGSLAGIKVAAFDTRIPSQGANWFVSLIVKLIGYAAQPLAKSLAQKGGVPIVQPEGFNVTGKEGPLQDGELERATAWAQQILAKA
jgi:flavodoxin